MEKQWFQQWFQQWFLVGSKKCPTNYAIIIWANLIKLIFSLIKKIKQKNQKTKLIKTEEIK
jgi:hypothetical protein